MVPGKLVAACGLLCLERSCFMCLDEMQHLATLAAFALCWLQTPLHTSYESSSPMLPL